MTNEKLRSPARFANDISIILNAVLGAERYPVDVKAIAKEYSQQCFPDDPITLTKGASLDGFDGALCRAPAGKKGWGIIYNSDISSPGRINFTLAHEFGHYLVHRQDFPDGIECSSQDMVRWDSEYGQIESQANDFAATLLMPLDDYRRQIDDATKPTLDNLSVCADRYGVSLIAVVLRWLQYTLRRACVVVSRDGFVLWARSSKKAWKTGKYIKTANRPPVPVPLTSLAANRNFITESKGSTFHRENVWFDEECEENVLFSDQYDFVISLIHFSNELVDHPEDDEVQIDRPTW